MPSIHEDRAIKKIDDDSNEVNDVNILDAIKMAKFKDLVKVGTGFLIPKTKLAFTKVPILHHFNSNCHL